MIVLKVFGHLGELASLTKTKYRRLVDVDDTLTTHAERETAVFVNDSVAGETRLGESRGFCVR